MMSIYINMAFFFCNNYFLQNAFKKKKRQNKYLNRHIDATFSFVDSDSSLYLSTHSSLLFGADSSIAIFFCL